ncbi:MAG: protein-glutamate O-methyltransferase [Mariprofundaceae bacterium]|nr:protein-glutamate O-methyltransferase [Mariprofundaceae bacterium]
MPEQQREFPYTRADFDHLCQLVDRHTGIQLAMGKEDMLYGRLSRRIRKVGLSSFKDYIRLLEKDEGSDEFGEFINSVTTNLTAFFRESHHFDYLKQTLLPELMRKNSHSRRIRIWSAGSSTGEEPYSIAMTVAETMPAGWDVKILATDLDTDVLLHGERGIYDVSRVEGLSKAVVQRWFVKNKNAPDKVRVKPELQQLIYFRQLNLLQEWPMKGPVDIIFCRNVIIYFDMPSKQKLMDRYADMLVDGGHLFLGHSEAMNNMSSRFILGGKSVYSKRGN